MRRRWFCLDGRLSNRATARRNRRSLTRHFAAGLKLPPEEIDDPLAASWADLLSSRCHLERPLEQCDLLASRYWLITEPGRN